MTGQDRTSDGGVQQWWRSLGSGQRIVAGVIGVVVLVNLALSAVESTIGGSEPGGPISSSFSTGDRGMEAYADLAAAAGHPVTRLRDPLSAERLAPESPDGTVTVVIADPGASEQSAPMTEAEAQVLVDFVADGGRLVVAGPTSWPIVQVVAGQQLAAVDVEPVDELDVWLPVADVGGAQVLHGDAGLRWHDPGSLTPVAGSGGATSVLVGDIGQGRLVVLADSGLLHNKNLASGDNAAFGLGILGDQGSRVVFVESVHGFGRTGLAAVPGAWKRAALALVVVVLVGLWAAGSRFGPPEPDRRSLRPPRRDHVDAVAANLHRVSPDATGAVAPLAADLRSQIARELHQPADASAAVLLRAADDVGADPVDVETIVSPSTDLTQALAVGSLAARRQRSRWGVTTPPPPDTLPTTPPRGADT